MALYELHDRPSLDQPVLVVVLEGWIDAGFAAGRAMQTLLNEAMKLEQSERVRGLSGAFVRE